MPNPSEFRRARETLRYEAPSIADTIHYHPSEISSSPFNAAYAANSVLTSLAQLAAVRLDAAGAFISFFDHQFQYILAQATQASSILRPRNHDDRECLLVGKAIPRPCGFCEDVLLDKHPEKASPSIDEENNHGLSVSVISDVVSSTESSTPAGMPGLPDARFYAAVPIQSPQGLNIGVFVVYDTQPKTAIEARHITFLRDMSSTVTSHLQMKHARTSLRRSERMVRGLGSFVEGAAGMSYTVSAESNGSFWNQGPEGTLNAVQQDVQFSARELESQSPFVAQFHPLSHGASHSQRGFALPPSPPANHPQWPKEGPFFDLRQRQEPKTPAFLTSASSSVINVGASDSGESDEGEHMSSIKSLFSRAANIIRESIEVEGVVFMDANLSTFGGLVGTGNDPSSPSPQSSSEDNAIDHTGDNRNDVCDLLGYSTTVTSSIDKGLETPFNPQIPQSFLKSLLRRYPTGKIYHFSDSGSVATSGDSSGNETTKSASGDNVTTPPIEVVTSDKAELRKRPSKWSKHNEGATLQKIFPDARSIALLPLWDYNKERWYAGGIVWTCTPARMFTTEADLSYLRAFGMSMLSELARLEVQIYDRAKSDVLGALSHELRSPLHGVVAATDLLHDTTLDAFQCDVVHSLESCGRVLLDVLNHLLDYSKVNTFMLDDKAYRKGRKSKGSSQFGQRSLRQNLSRLSSFTQLDSLLEESIDSVFAGHTFQKLSIAQVDHRSNLDADARLLRRNDSIDAVESFSHRSRSRSKFDVPPGEVCVLVDIDPSVSWRFCTQPGAIRRIVLNLLGNSLKYTDRGSIFITLRQEANVQRRSQHSKNIKLTITDTGRGIGAYYMQHHLFTPFSQEDRLSPGTGLGLSLVKQIVKTLGGNMTIESAVGVGTSVRVSIPVSGASDEESTAGNFDEHRTALSGLRVSLVGLGTRTRTMFRDESITSESKLMHRICAKSLNLQIVELRDGKILPDLVICGESGMEDFLKYSEKARLPAPIVVICKDTVTSHQYSKSLKRTGGHQIVEFISQPIGPRKLAKSLDTALKRWVDTAQAETPTTSRPTLRLRPSNNPYLADPQNSEPDSSAGNYIRNNTHAKDASPSPERDQHHSAQPTVTPKQHDSEERTADDEHADSTSTTGEREEILLVDDNNINLRILEAYMKKLNRPYKTALNGLEAFEVFSAAPSNYSCILMDLSMPVMGGLESTRKIRELERARNLKPTAIIVALTGLASLDSQQEAFASGMDVYLTKPVRFKELAEILTTNPNI